MPSPAELAAKRRARLLARSQKGNGVRVVTAESLEQQKQADAANAVAGEDTPVSVPSEESDAHEGPESGSSVNEGEVPASDSAKGKEEVVEEEGVSEKGPAPGSEGRGGKETNLDAILDEAVEETAPTDGNKGEEPVEEEKKRISRPLAARRERIAAQRAAAAAVAKDGEGKDGDSSTADDSPRGDSEETEEERKKFSFISKAAREVELEIAQRTKKSDEEVKGTVDSSEVGKVLMGKEKGTTSTIRKRTSRTGAGAGGSNKSNESASEVSSPKSTDSRKDPVLERKIDVLVKQQQTTDANWLPKLLRVLMLIALAAYAGYTSYLESPEGVSVMMLRQERGFDRDFFDLSSVTGVTKGGKKKACCAKHAKEMETAEAAAEEKPDDAAFDEATLAGAASASIVDAIAHELGVPSYVPTFECSQAWADTTSISFTIIMVLGTISDRLLKSKTPGKQDEGLAGILAWFWETYNQGYEAIYEYIFNYIGEYAAYWIVIVAVSSGLSYLSASPSAAEGGMMMASFEEDAGVELDEL